MTPEQQAAMRQARDWIAERPEDRPISAGKMVSILTLALEQQPADEPVAVILEDMKGGGYIEWLNDTYFVSGTKFYTRPQQAAQCEHIRHTKEGTHWCALAEKQSAWVGLTDEEIWDAYMGCPVDIDCHVSDLHKFGQAIEAKLKSKNEHQ